MVNQANNDAPVIARIKVVGRHIDLGESLRARAEEQVTGLVAKHFGRATDALITFSRPSKDSGFRCNISLRVASGLDFDGEASNHDVHAALTGAAGHVAAQLRRAKGMLRDGRVAHA